MADQVFDDAYLKLARAKADKEHAHQAVLDACEDVERAEDTLCHVVMIRTAAKHVIFSRNKIRVLTAPGASNDKAMALLDGLVEAANHVLDNLHDITADARMSLVDAHDEADMQAELAEEADEVVMEASRYSEKPLEWVVSILLAPTDTPDPVKRFATEAEAIAWINASEDSPSRYRWKHDPAFDYPVG